MRHGAKTGRILSSKTNIYAGIRPALMEVLSSGKKSFKVEVPYKLFQTGKEVAKPLIVYLHGAGQNLQSFEKKMAVFQEVQAYHLFIQAPYAHVSRPKERGKWGYSWYLYNGKQGSFIKSLEYTSEFIQGVIDNLRAHINVNRLCVLGYSMGGYQAGYFALSRWKHVNDVINLAGRYKLESFTPQQLERCRHMNIIAVHGRDDSIVELDGQQKAITQLQEAGLSARMVPVGGGHKIQDSMTDAILELLYEIGYQKATS